MKDLMIIGLAMCLTLTAAIAQPVTKEESEQAKVIAKLADKVDNSAVGIGNLALRIMSLNKTVVDNEAATNRKLNALSSATNDSLKNDDRRLEYLFKELGAQKELTENRIRNIEIHVGDRLDALERIVSGKNGKGGLQQQVSVLHAKKVDKK